MINVQKCTAPSKTPPAHSTYKEEWLPVPPVKDPQAGTGSIPTFFTTNYTLCSKQSKFTLIQVTVEPRYNEVLGTTKTTLPHQVPHHIRATKLRNTKR